MRYLFLMIPFLALAACASLSESECKGGDWYAIGVEDGANGRSLDFKCAAENILYKKSAKVANMSRAVEGGPDSRGGGCPPV